jgi:predicted porin
MNKSLLALGVLSVFAFDAHAQSSVTLYGSIDGGVRYVKNANAAGASSVAVNSNGTNYSNRFGFRGVEDLGGGMNAHFDLEVGFNAGTGALDSATPTGNGYLFNRQASVGLGGPWGTLDFGHQFSISFRTIAMYDPFNYKIGYTYAALLPLPSNTVGSNATSVFGGTRLNNDVQYTKAFGPVTARGEISLGGVAGSATTNSAGAVGLTYADGPLTMGAAYTKKKVASSSGSANIPAAATGSSPTFGDDAWTLGASYTIGALRIAGGYNSETLKGALNPAATTGDLGVLLTPSGSNTSQKIAWLGAGYDVTPAFNITTGWFQTTYDTARIGNTPADGKKELFITGLTYNLSKRTYLYAEADYTKLIGNQILGVGTPTNQDHVIGASVGVVQRF